MNDLKILTIRDVLPVAKVEYANNVVPLSLVITGNSVGQANHVYINDIESPEFVVLSPGRILAQVPHSETDSVLRKVSVISDVPTVNRNSLLHFEIGASIKSIKGIEKLVQAFCKTLLQTPGSDRFRPEEGGGLLKIVGRDVSRGDSRTMQAAVVGAVSRTRDQLMTRQASDRKIPADERLLTAQTESVGFDSSTTTLVARVSISAVSGKVAVANLTL
jgi:phage baseplate assembly protein W